MHSSPKGARRLNEETIACPNVPVVCMMPRESKSCYGGWNFPYLKCVTSRYECRFSPVPKRTRSINDCSQVVECPNDLSRSVIIIAVCLVASLQVVALGVACGAFVWLGC